MMKWEADLNSMNTTPKGLFVTKKQPKVLWIALEKIDNMSDRHFAERSTLYMSQFITSTICRFGNSTIFDATNLCRYRQFVNVALVRTEQGCQMVCFKTKNPKLGKFGRAF
jgi:hypothetical protein